MTATESVFTARHTCDSPEWYSPSPIVEAARELMGGIDLDPASHEEANRTVKAMRFFTAEENGLRQRWFGRVFINSPGGKDENGALVPQFWRKLLQEWNDSFRSNHVEQVIWIGYSLEQLQTLQQCAASATPLEFPMCVPRARIAFVENEAKKAERIAKLIAKGKNPNEKSQPSHANYITYFGARVAEFRRIFERFGAVR